MILAKANQLPPFICRILARRKGAWQAMSLRDIADASGIPKSRVALIAVMKTWDEVPLSQVERFSAACGVDLMHPCRHKKWLRESDLRHVLRGHKKQQAVILRTLQQ